MNAMYFFLQSIPEGMGVTALSLAIARVPLRWMHIFLGGIIISVASYTIRALPVTFGLHLPVVIFLVFVLMVRFTNTKPSRAIIAVFASIFILALLEFVISSAYFFATKMDFQQAQAQQDTWAIVGLIQAVLLNIIAVIVQRFVRTNEEAWKS